MKQGVDLFRDKIITDNANTNISEPNIQSLQEAQLLQTGCVMLCVTE